MVLSESQIQALRTLAASNAWEVARDTVFRQIVKDLQDVNQPILVPRDQKYTSGEAFVAKQLASQMLNRLIKILDAYEGMDDNRGDAENFE